MVYSLITLFPPDATSFATNGLGSLGEAVSCEVTEERNGSFELEMVYPVSGKHYKDIEIRSIIFAKPNPVDSRQAFRIYGYTKPMDGMVTYRAAHISYDLSGYPVNPFTAVSPQEACEALKANSVLDHPFTFRSSVTASGSIKVSTPTSIRSVLGGSDESILGVFGGEYQFNNFEVYLRNRRGSNRGVVIRYGKNLVDIKQEENVSEVYTDVLPYWYGEVDEIPTLVTLPEMTIATSTAFIYHRVLPLDLSSNFQEKPFVVDLREAANAWIKENNPGVPVASFEVSFAQLEQTEEYKNFALLERVELCDEVTVEYPDFGISASAKVTKTVYNVMTGSYTSVTLGDIHPTISGTISGQEGDLKDSTDSLKSALQNSLNSAKKELNDNINDAKDELNGNINDAKDELNGSINDAKDEFQKALDKTKSDLEKATEDATNWITNGRGYMVAVKNEIGQWIEICSLDTPNTEEAINVWRWNNAGFGHSSHGYNGPFDVAITQDGKINAEFIVTGEMSANRIKGGILTLGGLNNGNGSIVTKAADDSNVCTIDVTGLNAYKGTITGTKFIAIDPTEAGVAPTEITISDSEINFYEGQYDTDKVTDNYAGVITPEAHWGATYWSESDDVFVDSSDGWFPGLLLDARYILSVISGGVRHIDIDLGGVRVLSDLFTRYVTVSNELTATTGKFNSLYVAGLPVTGDVILGDPGEEGPSVITAQSYGYSLTSPMKGDIGSGETDESGLCYIYLDEYAASAVNTSMEYYVFLQKEGNGDIWVKEKTAQYFVVEGTSNLKFSWELKGKQKGYEYERLENVDTLKMIYDDPEEELIKEALEEKANLIMTKDTEQLKEIEQAIEDREGGGKI